MSGTRRRKHTNFHAAFVAIALSGINEEKAKKIGQRAASFLASHQGKEGTWNYWHPLAADCISEPYPDDLDDTASALSAIALYEPELLAGTDLACFVKSLCAGEAGIGGPYRTWCIKEATEGIENEIDIGVNAAIGYALSIHGIELIGLNSYIDKAIEDDLLTSRYYFDEITLIYLISRWYKGQHTRILIDTLYRRLETMSAHDDALAMSMALSSLYRLGEHTPALEVYAKALAQQIMRGPKPHGMYIEKIDSGIAWYSGSGALTAAVCAEALFLAMPSSESFEHNEDVLYQKICAAALKILNEEKSLDPDQIERFIEYALGGENRKKIALLPFHCCSIEDIGFDSKTIISAGVAHFLGTIAYGVFDKDADGQGDSTDPIYVSLGLICHAECISILSALSKNDASIGEMIRKMGNKAIWESKKASFQRGLEVEISSIPDFISEKVLENKSIGISLAPISIIGLVSSGASASVHLREFFSHYCAARHIHDDVHDWKEDLSRGRINSAAATSLMLEVEERSMSLPIRCTYEELEKNISRTLMTEGISVICGNILRHVAEAEKAITRLGKNPHINTEFLRSLISPLRRGAERALREQKVLDEFTLDLAGGKL